jgi:hypothetical protein
VGGGSFGSLESSFGSPFLQRWLPLVFGGQKTRYGFVRTRSLLRRPADSFFVVISSSIYPNDPDLEDQSFILKPNRC